MNIVLLCESSLPPPVSPFRYSRPKRWSVSSLASYTCNFASSS